MENLKRLGAAIALTFALGLSVFAADPPTGSCDPGETHGPPCITAQMPPDDSVAPVETNASPASNAGDAPSVTEVAIDLLQSVLSIY
jgi:hypothetical protein